MADYIASRARTGVPPEEGPSKTSPKGRIYTHKGPWSPSMIGLALAAIGKAHELTGAWNPRHHIAVRTVWAGIAREKGLAPKRRASPLLVPDLRGVLSTAFPATLRGKRDRALLLLGFGAALRRSELAALEVSDLTFEARGVAVAVRRHLVGPKGETAAGSKADQEGRGQVVAVHRVAAGDTGLCPIRAVEVWLEAAGVREGRLFRRILPSGPSEKGLSGGQIARIVKRAARRIGLDPKDYSGHSLRAGLATSAARDGRPLWAIQKQTRHAKLDTLAGYIRSVLAFEDNVTEGLL